MKTKIVRRISDGKRFTAVQYAREDGGWDSSCITTVAAFLLGLDPDRSSTVRNDRMLDVVKPVLTAFNPAQGRADLEVCGPGSPHSSVIKIGDWILKDPQPDQLFGSSFIFVTNDAMKTDFEDYSRYDELHDLIHDVLETQEVDSAQAYHLAGKIAGELIRAGWSK